MYVLTARSSPQIISVCAERHLQSNSKCKSSNMDHTFIPIYGLFKKKKKKKKKETVSMPETL